MKRTVLRLLSATAIFSAAAYAAFAQTPASVTPASSAPPVNTQPTDEHSIANPSRGLDRLRTMKIDLMAARGFKKPAPARSAGKNLVTAAPGSAASFTIESSSVPLAAESDPSSGLPLWTFTVRSSRDGTTYPGTMVGRNPFRDPGPANIPTDVVPVIVKTQTIATIFNPKTGIISTAPGSNTLDPTQPDDVCLSPPNDVPTKLASGSPIFSSAPFTFGGTFIGNTQYTDAFQRGNFWNVLAEDRGSYHVRMKPVRLLQPIVLNVPAVYGLAITNPLFFGPPAFCAPLTIVDIAWFDNYVTSTLIPGLASQGVSPSHFPIFFVYNVVWASPVTNLNNCCALGYHSVTGFPHVNQTYSPSDFDTTGAFGIPLNTVILSHEVGEWMNDPNTNNPTPLWGNTGQVQGACQGNLEVGDPLTGNLVSDVTMPNGYTYHLQELAFFSWFFGAPSIGVNGWFSNNNTFKTDAGPPCF
jgi:hypothetical protein